MCPSLSFFFFFLMIRRPPRSTLFPYTDALPICRRVVPQGDIDHVRQLELRHALGQVRRERGRRRRLGGRSEEHTSELQSRLHLVCRLLLEKKKHETSATHRACARV